MLRPLPSVRNAVLDVARAVDALGIRVSDVLHDPTLERWTAAWKAVCERAGDEPLIVHFSGHGLSVDKDLYLAVYDTDPRPGHVHGSAVEVAALLRAVDRGTGGPVLFLLDVCGAGAALRPQLVAQLAEVRKRRAWVIAACPADEITYGARFSAAAATVLEEIARRELFVPTSRPYVPVELLAARIDEVMARADAEQGRPKQDVVRTSYDEAVLPTAPFLANPWFRERPSDAYLAHLDEGLHHFVGALDPRFDVVHFATRAAGTADGELFHFSGRARQLTRVKEWLDDPSGVQDRLLVVTGSPGAGKSALLGAAVCSVHPTLVALRARLDLRGFRPEPDPRLLAVHARRLTVRQVVASLHRQARAVGAPPGDDLPYGPDEAVSPQELFAALAEGGGATVVVDALDEADDPEELLREVVLPLAGRPQTRTTPGCRVLLGTRMWPDALLDLHSVLDERPDLRLDLDREEPEVLADDLGVYLEKLLDPHYSAATAQAIAGRLAESAQEGHFLTAFLYATHLQARHAAGSPPAPAEIVAGLPSDLPGVLDLNLRTLTAEDPWTGPVLAAVGRAAGAGMPLELVHAVALELAPETRDRLLPPRPEDTRRALEGARFHLRTTTDGDRQLYRFFHQALAEHMAPRAAPAAVLDALLAKVPAEGGVRDWSAADRYLRRHAADHAAEAGARELDALLADPGHLLHAEPDRLVPHLHRAQRPRARRNADVYRQTTAHHPLRDSPTARRDLLVLDAVVWQDADLAAAVAASAGPPPSFVRPRWALSRTAAAARLHVLGAHAGPLTRVLLAEPSDAVHGVAVTAGADGRVCLWDPLSGRALGDLDAAAGAVRAVAATRLADGREVLALFGGSGLREQDWLLGSAGGRLFVHDLGTGDLLGALEPEVPRPTLLSTLTLPDVGARAVSAGSGRKVQFWDLEAGRLLFERDSPLPLVRALATGVRRDGRAVAIAAGDEYAAMVWDLRTGRRLHRLGPHGDFVSAVAVAHRARGSVVAVTGGVDATLRVWDLDDGGGLLHTLCGHRAWVTTVVSGTDGGRSLAVSGDRQGRVLVWDLDRGHLLHDLRGRHGVITCAAVLGDPRAGLAVTGCADGRVAVWNLRTGARTHWFAAHAEGVQDVAVRRIGDRVLVLSGGMDGRAVVWEVTPEDVGGTAEPPDDRADGPSGGRCASPSADPSGGPSADPPGDRSTDRGVGPSGDLRVDRPDGGRAGGSDADSAGGANEAAAVGTVGGPAGAAVGAGTVRGAEGADRGVGDAPPEASAGAAGAQAVPKALAAADGAGDAGAEAAPDGGSRGRAEVAGAGRVPAVRGEPVDSVALALPGAGPALLVVGGGSALEVREFATGRHRHRLAAADRRRVRAVATAELPGVGPVAVTGGRDGLLRTWDLTSGAHLSSFDGPRRIRALDCGRTMDGRPVVVAGGDDGTAEVRDLATGALVSRFLGHAGARILSLAVAEPPGAPGVVVSGDALGGLLVWDLSSGHGAGTPAVRATPVHALATAVLPGGRAVAVAGGEAGEVRVWDLPAPEAPHHLTGLERRVTALSTARLADGTVVAAGGGDDRWVAFWDLRTRRELRPAYHVPADVSALAACPAGLAVAHAEGTAALRWAPPRTTSHHPGGSERPSR
ncbi:caspase family protein [Streptomyces actuosus]|uniref:Caspase family protein n=1 Tax=Streptomyces actuosus TaxID=1885 RepID=A0ABS2VI35_STRAS|nr:AAA family ATPase [Streptomyces actuosus]MBN0042726.1 caspase family protein [Streptomyces actuosus]